MYNIINLILFYSLFHHIGNSLNNSKIFMTIIKISVSIICCLQYFIYTNSFYYMKPLLISFFLYDIFYIFFYIGLKKLTYNVVIYHHISLTYCLLYEPTAINTMPLFIFIGELSNIPMYSHYLLIQYSNIKATNVSNKLLQLSFFIEVSTYILCRYVFYTYYFIISYPHYQLQHGFAFYYMHFPLYIMGLNWGKNLINQFILDIRYKNKLF